MLKAFTSVLFFIFILAFNFNLLAQKPKAKELEKKSPLIGVWQSEGSVAPELISGEPHEILGLSEGTEQSMVAFNDSEYGYAGPSYFIAKSDGKKIYGTLVSSSIPVLEGSEISFGYRYDKGKDKLIIIIDKKEFIMKRIVK